MVRGIIQKHSSKQYCSAEADLTFIMKKGKQRNFFPCVVRKFVWQNIMTPDCKSLIQLVYHILLSGPGREKLLKPSHGLTLDVSVVVSSPLVLANENSFKGREFFLFIHPQVES